MSYYKQTVAAAATWEVQESGNFFRLLNTTGNVKVEFYRMGVMVSVAENVQGGLWREGEFDRVRIVDQSAAPNTVDFMIDLARVGYDRAAGTVTVATLNPTRFTGANTQRTVTTTSAQLVAANASRSYLLIQNKDSAGTIWVTFGATAATQAKGIMIGPGQSLELGCNVTTGAMQAIGDIASNAGVVTVEG